ncbi:MAG: alanine dehydrogenase [Bacteroidota bacterium]|nr:alanine dehydrogenase [Bacteroidota bacterium]
MTDAKSKLAGKHNLFPLEEMLEEYKQKRSLKIGIPKEESKFEHRVPLSPDGVKILSRRNHKIYIEQNAGLSCNWTDAEYSSAGAVISDREKIFKQEIIAKISPFNTKDIELLHKGQMLFSALHSSSQTAKNIKKLMAKKVTAIAFELISDSNNYSPFLHPVSEISGILAINEASKYMSLAVNGRGILLGGITGMPAAEVVILGAETAGISAAKAALGLGADIKIFDYNLQNLYKLKSHLPHGVSTYLIKDSLLKKHIKTADVIVGAMNFKAGETGNFINSDMVMKMKKNSVIIDLNADNISAFETSRPTNSGSPVYKTHHVIHYCVPNIAALVPTTTSEAFSNALAPILGDIAAVRHSNSVISKDSSLKSGTYIYNGILTNKGLGKKFDFQYSDINLISSVF